MHKFVKSTFNVVALSDPDFWSIRFSSRRSWSMHDPQSMAKVLQQPQAAHSSSPFGPRFARFIWLYLCPCDVRAQLALQLNPEASYRLARFHPSLCLSSRHWFHIACPLESVGFGVEGFGY